jgi:hypothetical protein
MTQSDANSYKRALAERSSHVENVLTHALVAAVAQDLWHRDPWVSLQIFQAEVDNAGFDLVLGCAGVMRYIQVKQVHVKGAASKFSIRLDFSLLPGSCAVVVVHEAESLEIDHFLFFGGHADEPMPSIKHQRSTKVPGRRNAVGERKVRLHYRDVPRKNFVGPLTAHDLVDRLFPELGHNRSFQPAASSGD